jgi:hypothetical protein
LTAQKLEAEAMKNLTAARDASGSEEPDAASGWSFFTTVENVKLIVESGATPPAQFLSTLNFQLSTN